MPRYTNTQLRWSEQAQAYTFLIDNQISKQILSHDWLEQNTSFAFYSRSGMHYTVRKQKGQRGGKYWYAYRRLHGRIEKRYLGKETDLTLARLEEIALVLENSTILPANTFLQSQTSTPTYPIPGSVAAQKDPSFLHAEASPLLSTKLVQPHLPARLLDRSHLFPLLDAGLEKPLTLISAPAGFGKTTLVGQWLTAQRTRDSLLPIAWVSLENTENDLLRFWSYLIAACQTFHVDLMQVHHLIADLTPQPPFVAESLSHLLTILLNTLTQAVQGGILLLDNYQAITEHTVHEALLFFLQHLPEHIHVYMITRADPPFPLSSMRAHNTLNEVRTAELRFSLEETTLFLQQSHSLVLEQEQIQQIHTQLEGWGAGLQLTKLILQQTQRPLENMQTQALLTKDNSSFLEYFVSEILNHQPQAVQQFLLQTSILPELTASLCDAITALDQSLEMLTLLEQNNLFLERIYHAPYQGYRYHTLFGAALLHEARRRLGEDTLRQLSGRASRWYEEHGFLDTAIDTALDAQDYMRATRLLLRFLENHTIPGEMREPYRLQHWFKQLPERYLEQSPILCLHYATVLLLQNTTWKPAISSRPLIEKLLRMAEDFNQATERSEQRGEILAFQALFALRQGDMRTASIYSRHALAWLPQQQHIWRGLCITIAANEWETLGDFQQAHDALREAQARLAMVGNHLFHQVATVKLAGVLTAQGELRKATQLYRQALEVALTTVNENLTSAFAHWRCIALLGLASLCYERNELERVAQLLQETIALSQTYTFPQHEVHAYIMQARIYQAQEQTLVAQQQLSELLERTPISQPLLQQDIQIAQARLALAMEDIITIQHWVATKTSSNDFARRVEEDLLHAGWLRLQGKEEQAYHQLEEILIRTGEVGYMRGKLQTMAQMILHALAHKHKEEAQDLLHELLGLALPDLPLRLFIDAGAPMAMLLRSLLPHCQDQLLLAYIRILLQAFPIRRSDDTITTSALIEALSPQELRVLRLLAEHRSNAEIATAMVVSINTVRTQIQSIYRKLGVHKRSAAFAMAHELQLI